MLEINKIHNGDSLKLLKKLPDNSIHCIVTSPPYWGLRDYGTGIWKGGDKSCSHKPGDTPTKRGLSSSTLSGGKKSTAHQQEGYKGVCSSCGAVRVDKQIGLEQSPDEYVKNIVKIFKEAYRILREDGTLWLNLGDSYCGGGRAGNNPENYGNHKMFGKTGWNPSVFGRAQKVPNGLKPKDLVGIPWMVAFALRTIGYYLRDDIIWHKPNPMPESVTDRPTRAHEYIFLMTKSNCYYYDHNSIKTKPIDPIDDLRRTWNNKEGSKSLPSKLKNGIRPRGHVRRHTGFEQDWDAMTKDEQASHGANKRDVWTVATKPYPDAHFATFPEELIIDCIKAGCPENGIVLDMFSGAGTTALVASKLNRNFIGIELNAKYVKIAEKRLQKELGLFNKNIQ